MGIVVKFPCVSNGCANDRRKAYDRSPPTEPATIAILQTVRRTRTDDLDYTSFSASMFGTADPGEAAF